ncbi:hypothetical protein FB567DRAFT_150338 [Paraphoma chrysanthemicola]|uniref:Uncharacterized protein n=1 Tax=Paraphoma chrysanthemicola TaxID=798071 RepID=A0A8K0QX14_9PLEO|nr:hypothetical protein FB567DRAFT_150338 [Paraphoma chrysanthemicola]
MAGIRAAGAVLNVLTAGRSALHLIPLGLNQRHSDVPRHCLLGYNCHVPVTSVAPIVHRIWGKMWVCGECSAEVWTAPSKNRRATRR